MNVKVKFGIKKETQVLLMRTFSDGIVIECDGGYIYVFDW